MTKLETLQRRLIDITEPIASRFNVDWEVTICDDNVAIKLMSGDYYMSSTVSPKNVALAEYPTMFCTQEIITTLITLVSQASNSSVNFGGESDVEFWNYSDSE